MADLKLFLWFLVIFMLCVGAAVFLTDAVFTSIDAVFISIESGELQSNVGTFFGEISKSYNEAKND